MKIQLQADLKIMKHTLDSSHLSWKVWCTNLPDLESINYTVFKKDGTIICDSMDNNILTNRIVFAEIEIEDNMVVRKTIPLSSMQVNMEQFDQILFMRIVPFAIISYLIFIFFFYKLTMPLGTILSKVEKFKYELPFDKNLKLLYRRDEWSSIEEALNEADQRLQEQELEAKVEYAKNTAILESINDDIIAIDRYETVLFYNSKFERRFISNRKGQLINQKVWHIFSDDVLSAFQEVLSTGLPSSLKAKNFPASQSPHRFFDLTITPLKSANGNITGALGVFYDVTDFKLTEQMRVDFVANVSHEIRTPLTSIKGFTQILQSQSDKIDSSLQPFMNKIISNTERMISLFNDLLNLSVIESRDAIMIEEFSLKEIVDGVESNIVASYPDMNVSFENDVRLENLKGDQRLIEQAILNLSDNACKYAQKEVTIFISSFEKNHKAYVVVRDNGPGIEKRHLPRIFERFYRVDASRESLRGTGLGLSIVKQIISKHGGRIWAESDGPGTGTSFVIELPLE